MNELIVRFAEIGWEEIGPYARQKVVPGSGHRLRLLELKPGFEEVQWCHAGHIGFVVSGAFQIQFSHRLENVVEGDAIRIDSGESSKHRAIVGDHPVRLFLVEE